MAWIGLGLALALAAPADAAAPAPLTTAVQVTHGFFDDPSFSPDGKRMVVLSESTGREQLAILSRDGKMIRTLTKDEFDHEDPAWSPDGRWIAYVSKARGGEAIHLMHPDGSGDVALTPPTERVIHPSWSHDGRTLLYCSDDDLKPPAKNDADILAMDMESHTVRRLVTGGVNTYPNLSPDGRRLAFRKMVGTSNSEVWTADGDGAHPRNLTNNPAFDGWPDWSPDGKTIAFASNRDSGGAYRIYVMDAEGANVRLVADTAGRGTAPKWSHDGHAIYFTVCDKMDGKPSCEIWRADLPRPARG